MWSWPCPGLRPGVHSPTLSGTHLHLLPTHLPIDPPCHQDSQHHLLTGLGWLEGVLQSASAPAWREAPGRPAPCSNRHRRTHREDKEGLGQYLNNESCGPATEGLEEPGARSSPPASVSPSSSSAVGVTAPPTGSTAPTSGLGRPRAARYLTAAARRWWSAVANGPTPPTSTRWR